MAETANYLDLYDYRLRVAEMYRERNRALEDGQDPATVLAHFRAQRDQLFETHPQSALGADQRLSFHGLSYFPYDPEARVQAALEPVEDGDRTLVETSGTESMPMTRAGTAHLTVGGSSLALAVYWIDVYGGGLFLPFRDATAPEETYGGGRYLFDTVKGSDFSILDRRSDSWRIVLDFNYAYNPSCAYDYRWVCPLAPPENRMPLPIRAGEKRFDL